MTTGAAAAISAKRTAGDRNSTASPLAREQELAQRAIRRRIGEDERVLEAFPDRLHAHALEKRRERVLVIAPHDAGVESEPRAGLQIGELDGALVRQVELLAAEDLEQHDLVAHPRRAPQLRHR